MKKKELLALVQTSEARNADLKALITYLEADIASKTNELEQLRVRCFFFEFNIYM